MTSALFLAFALVIGILLIGALTFAGLIAGFNAMKAKRR